MPVSMTLNETQGQRGLTEMCVKNIFVEKFCLFKFTLCGYCICGHMNLFVILLFKGNRWCILSMQKFKYWLLDDV